MTRPEMPIDMSATPVGLLALDRRRFRWVVALYVALAIAVLAIPAALVHPRGSSSHLSQQEVHTTPGRAER